MIYIIVHKFLVLGVDRLMVTLPEHNGDL